MDSRYISREEEEPLRTILRHFTYRPGWTFSVRDGCLYIEGQVIDTDDFSRTISVVFHQHLPRWTNSSFPWEKWLFDMIMKVERHEALEFFRIDGVKVFDPHAGESSDYAEKIGDVI